MEKKMRHLGHDYSYKKFAHSEVEKVLQRFGSTWDGIKHQDIEELQERYGRNKIMSEKSFTAATFYKIVYHAVYFGVISTSHDFIFYRICLCCARGKRCYWRVNYVSDGHIKRHDEFCSISQIKQCS